MRIKKLDNKARGITYYNDKIMFVNNALPEEEVDVKDIHEYKKYYEAEVDVIREESVNRIIPKCPFYYSCGGCHLMHLSYEKEENYKLNKVREILNKYAGIKPVIKLIKNDRDLFYRNKVSLKVQNKKFGYFNLKTHNFISIDNCLLASNSINEFIKNHDYVDIINGEIMIRSNYNGELLIIINSNDDVKLNDNIPDNIKGIILNNKTIYKDNYFYDYIADMKFKLSYNSFFQVNNYMASEIFKVLRGNLKGEVLLDLYCGVGTLGLSLKDNFKKIYGIEKIDNAIKDATNNALLNDVKNAKYVVGDTSNIIKTLNESFDTIIVDPPRSGLNKDTLDKIIELKPDNLAYISCDPMTLARDLKVLKDYYDIKKVNVLDMFPNTYHVETICIMKKL